MLVNELIAESEDQHDNLTVCFGSAPVVECIKERGAASGQKETLLIAVALPRITSTALLLIV